MPPPSTAQTILSRGWTYVTNAGTSTAQLMSKTATPFLRRRLDASASLASVIQWANLFMTDMEVATRGSRSLPFGAGGTVILPIAFDVGTTVKIPHYLNTASLLAFWSVPTAGFGAPSATISFDSTYATIVPSGSFTAALFITVIP